MGLSEIPRTPNQPMKRLGQSLPREKRGSGKRSRSRGKIRIRSRTWSRTRKREQDQQQEQEQKKRRKHGTSDDGRRNGKCKKKNQRRRAEQDQMVEGRHGSVPNKEGWYIKQHARAVQHETTTFPRPILLLLAIFLKLYIADISG